MSTHCRCSRFHNVRIAQSGFTLIEMSIVLVIIGLIVGGILTGQDLIKAATLRSQLTQIERLNTDVRAFQNKYGGLPGDLLFTNASQFGFFTTGMTGAVGKGDGNGLIQDWSGDTTPGTELIYGEPYVFWRHLSDASMVEGGFGAGLVSGGNVPSNQTISQVPSWLLPAKIGRNAFVTVYSGNGSNYYQIMMIGAAGLAVALGVSGGWNQSPAFTPMESQSMDQKTDDGLPLSGKILAITGQNGWPMGQPPVSSAPADQCTIMTATPNVYNIGASTGNVVYCNMAFQFQ